jgi:hypothetical protein
MSIVLYPALLLLVWSAVSVAAQPASLSARLSGRGNTNVVVDFNLGSEGSYQLQRAPALNSNGWSVVTNFVSAAGPRSVAEPRGGAARYYRLLQFTNPPSILQQPVGTNVFAPAEVRLSAGVSGAEPLRFRWYRDGRAIDGAIGANLIFPSRTDLSGNYSLVATNPWGAVTSSVVAVQITNAVALTISGRSIRFVITGLQGDFTTPGNYTTTFNPLGFYNTSGSSFFLNDTGNWQYNILNEAQARIFLPGSFIYPNGTISLGFQNPGAGTYQLVVPGYSGSQIGTFQFLE